MELATVSEVSYTSSQIRISIRTEGNECNYRMERYDLGTRYCKYMHSWKSGSEMIGGSQGSSKGIPLYLIPSLYCCEVRLPKFMSIQRG